MPKIGTRSYSLEVKDEHMNKTVVIEPPTEIQFDITMAIYSKLSIGYMKVYNPDTYLKNFLLYRYPVGDERNKLYIDFKPIKLGVAKDGYTAYSYASSTKAYVYQTTLIHPNPKEEYIHLELLSGYYNLFSKVYNTTEKSRVNTTVDSLLKMLSKEGYPVSYDGSLRTNTRLFSSRKPLKEMFDELLKLDEESSTSYIEDLNLKIFKADPEKGQGSRGRIGSYDRPYEIDPEDGLISFPQQVNNDIVFRHTLDYKFPLDSYVRVSKDMVNRQIVTPSVNAGAGGLNWLLGYEDKYRVLSYRLVGDYFDPGVWYQDIVAQSGNMPLAANLSYNSTIGAGL